MARSEARSLAIEASTPKSVGAAVDQIGHMIEPRLAQGQLARQVGEQELVALELDDAPARLPPRVHVGRHVLERGDGDAQRMRGDARPRLVERRQQDLQAVARLAQQVGARHAGLVEIRAASWTDARRPILSSGAARP